LILMMIMEEEFPPSNLPPELTGNRLDRFMAVIKDLPKDPSCGCVIWSEAARNMFRALIKEQIDIDMGVMEDGKQTEEKATDE
jgi:hypothetical protein